MEASSSTKAPRQGAAAAPATVTAAGQPLSSIVGNAVILLRDWGRYGLEERSLYHFDLTDALVSPENDTAEDEPQQELLGDSPSVDDADRQSESQSLRSCGFRALLECVPRDVRLRSDQKRKLRADIRALNSLSLRSDKKTALCCQPMRLPLKINTNSTIFFAYETTRMAFVLDASPALTSTLGRPHSGSDAALCPLDRLAGMSRTFFLSLAQPVRVSMPQRKSDTWTPKLAVSVLAVYPRRHGEAHCRTSLLVRDFRLVNQAGAEELVDEIKKWTYSTVETTIAQNLRQQQPYPGMLSSGLDGGAPTSSIVPTCLKDILDVADIALSTLSSSAKPVTVLATCARGIVCDTALDVLSDPNRLDNPLVVLDLSAPESHISQSSAQPPASSHQKMDLLSHDPEDGLFPLQLSDDADALYGICKATSGCFFDKTLLNEAANASAGEIESGSALFTDQLFSNKRHAVHPNAIQWYTLFALSPLVPITGSHLGRLPCPAYLRQKSPRYDESDKIKSELPSTSLKAAVTLPSLLKSVADKRSKSTTMRSIFTTYFVNPVRPTSLLLMRIREGYKVKQYGLSTIDPDKVSIQFMLPIDLGISIHYEMSYRAMAGHGNMVGFAHIKIELNGESSLIRRIKKDFLDQSERISASSGLVAQVSQSLCQRIHCIRKEDTLMTHLLPVKWSDPLLERNSLLLKRLGSMSAAQKQKHFRMDGFDVIVAQYDAAFSCSYNGDNTMAAFYNVLSEWATDIIHPGRCFLKRETSRTLGLPVYCIMELEERWNRLFSFNIWTPAGTAASVRLGLVASIKRLVVALEGMQILPNPIANFVVGRDTYSDHIWRIQNTKASWKLVKDSQLIPLLIKRRVGIGKFHLLELKEDYCLLAKLVPMEARGGEEFDEPGDLIQYELHGHAGDMKATLYMESEGGTFWKNILNDLNNTSNRSFVRFEKLVNTLKKRDQECSRALHCRTFLLNYLEGFQPGDASACIRRLLGYSSRSSSRLQCFHPDKCVEGNAILQKLTASTLLANNKGVRAVLLSHDKELNNVFADGNRQSAMAWFLLEHSPEILSIVCQPSEVNVENGESFLELHYFSVEIGDLYSKRDDEADDKAIDDMISTPECVDSFCDFIVQSHKLNYCTAAYLALLQDPSSHFTSAELQHVFGPLKFIEVCSVITTGGPRLTAILTSKLVHVSNDLFYYKWDADDKFIMESLRDDGSHASSLADGSHFSGYNEVGIGDDGVAFGDDLHSDDEDRSLDQRSTAFSKEEPVAIVGSGRGSRLAPIFAKVTGLDEEGSISKRISISLSVFEAQQLSKFHRRAANELLALLNAFAAEETLERLRNYGPNISDSDLKNAKSCVRRAHTTASCAVDLIFYVGKIDAMVSASVPSGCDREINDALDILLALLQRGDEVNLIPDTSGEFYTIEKEAGSPVLAYFCFMRVTKSQQIHIEVYHPKGHQASSEIVSMMRSVISSACHETNQLLLLKRLHSSRLASKLLIPLDENVQDTSAGVKEPDSSGSFQCPVVFTHQFSVFYRCATSAALRTVESSVLYPFTINNHRSYFVYKDESESIFYMKLDSSAEHQIMLVVHGISSPTTSITLQLTKLIEKRLLQLGVDMLSSMLIKNSHYAWKQSDFNFVRSFENDWKKVDIGKEYDESMDRYYGLFDQPTNSKILLLLLRQNLCGSTFFHVLNDADLSPGEMAEDIIRPPSRFYYNNAPATLDPTLQPNSTLTTKGAEYARLAGTGVAIIEVNFYCVASDRNEGDLGPSDIAPAGEAPVLQKLEAEPLPGASYVRVTIISTALRRKIIHDWIELSLNQVLVSFAIEQLISRTQRAYLKESLSLSSFPAGAEAARRGAIEAICPALPALKDLFASDSPHPAILKSLHQGAIRSSDVSHVALVALENLTKQLSNECNEDVGLLLLPDLSTIRLSRSHGPQRCSLKWTENRAATVIDVFEESTKMTRRVIDRNVDCPEYVFAYISRSQKDENVSWPSQLKLFGDIFINDKTESAVDKDARIFERSFAFILSIKRNQRLLYAYNWKRSTFKKVVTQLMEKEEIFFSSAAKTIGSLQSRCLKFLAPKSIVATEKQHHSTPVPSGDTTKDNDAKNNQPTVDAPSEVSERQGRRAIRPIAIRRPKLIGASVEGAAVHALTASRQRASSNIFRTGIASGTNTHKKNAEKPSVDPSSVNKLPDVRTEPAPKGRDSTMKAAQNYQTELLSLHSNSLRAHGLQYRAAGGCFQKLRRKSPEEIPCEMSNFLLSVVPVATSWSESTGDFAALPPDKAVSHLASFAKTLCGWIPGLKVSLCSIESEEAEDVLVFLAGVMKTTEMFRYKVVIRLTFEGFIVRSAVKLLYAGRQAKESYYTTRVLREKSCARLHSFAAHIRRWISLDQLVFDYLSSVGQLSMKRPNLDLAFADAFHLVDWLNGQHGLKRQVKNYCGHYKAFSCTANPSSYHDPLVDEFGGSCLLGWMLSKANDPDMIRCGQGALYFTRELVVRGSHSTCFVSTDKSSPNMIRLLFLCRSEGRNLFDFTFREGSCVAMTLLDRIAVEGAGLLLQELRKAALELRLDRLWNSLSQASNVRPSQLDLEMMLELSHVRPLTQVITSNSDTHLILNIFEGYTNWESLYEKMMNDGVFSPSWAVTRSDSFRQRLFYLKSDDLFLSLTVDDGDRLIDVSLVTREATSVNSETLQLSVAPKICNYLLFFLWSELVHK